MCFTVMDRRIIRGKLRVCFCTALIMSSKESCGSLYNENGLTKFGFCVKEQSIPCVHAVRRCLILFSFEKSLLPFVCVCVCVLQCRYFVREFAVLVSIVCFNSKLFVVRCCMLQCNYFLYLRGTWYRSVYVFA